MTRPLTRTNFNSSKLICILTDLSILEAAESGSAFAEKLGLWVGFADAITLCSAQSPNSERAQSGVPTISKSAVGEEFARVRANLVQSIIQSTATKGVRTRIARPSPKPGMSVEDAIAYGPYRRYHLAHQRDMELSVRPLRAKLREALTVASPALKQLAAIDSAYDGILSDRESKLFSTLPSLLEKRFAQLLAAHQQSPLDARKADTPDVWMKPGGWLARFCAELETVLLAELDVRLQPAVGLMEALNNEIENKNE
jgi:hypothetical protein